MSAISRRRSRQFLSVVFGRWKLEIRRSFVQHGWRHFLQCFSSIAGSMAAEMGIRPLTCVYLCLRSALVEHVDPSMSDEIVVQKTLIYTAGQFVNSKRLLFGDIRRGVQFVLSANELLPSLVCCRSLPSKRRYFGLATTRTRSDKRRNGFKSGQDRVCM